MPGRTFADVLADVLHHQAEPAAVRAASWRFAAPPPGPAAPFAVPGPSPLARAAYAVAAAAGAALPRPRPVHTLTLPQQTAFTGLNALGGRLTPDFTASDLRSAYRRLAHDLHPDRHYGRSELDRARLSRDFAAAAGHYQVLLTLFPRH